jgi:uncharacterized Zn finger protein
VGRYDRYYAPPAPKEVKGGIKAQNKRGAFARKWWGKRWIETLEGFRIGARMARGRAYARKGQVASLEIVPGEIRASVQGSRRGAYLVSIKLATLNAEQWEKIVDRIADEPIFAAMLFGGEMPEEIERIFTDAGISLFPARRNDLETACSCPDWSNPCKHVAAVYYLLAEAFDQDPFLLFRLRGMEREAFLERLRAAGAEEGATDAAPPVESEPLPVDHDAFWGKAALLPDHVAAAHAPALHAAIPKRLGRLPFWRAECDFIQEMEDIYRRASTLALSLMERECANADNGLSDTA